MSYELNQTTLLECEVELLKEQNNQLRMQIKELKKKLEHKTLLAALVSKYGNNYTIEQI